MEAVRVGIKYDPPALVMDYIVVASGSPIAMRAKARGGFWLTEETTPSRAVGTKRRRKMPLRRVTLTTLSVPAGTLSPRLC